MAGALAVGLICAFAAPQAPLAEKGSTWVKVAVNDRDSVWVKISISDVLPVVAPVASDTALAETVPIVGEPDGFGAESVDAVVDGGAGQEEEETAAVVTTRKRDWSAPLFPKSGRARFVWGAEFGSSVDMSGQDMTSIDINALFGMSCGWFTFIGVGAAADVTVSNSNRSYPVFVALQTDFSHFHRPLFLDLRGGMSVNCLPANATRKGAYGSASLGFRLATGEKFRSYLTAGYTYIGRDDFDTGEIIVGQKALQMVTVRFGVTF